MACTKNCPCANPPSSSSSPSPSPTHPPLPPLIKMSVPAATLLSPSLPPPPPLPPILSNTSTPAVKSVPSTPPAQIIVGPPRKKIAYPGPFIKGQIGSVFFSLNKVHSCMEIPHGYSIIVQNFCFQYKFEACFSKYVIINPIGNKWDAPEVFEKWRNCVETRTLEDLDLMKTRLAIVCYGNTFKLCTSDKKSNYQTQTHFVPSVELAEEDAREKKDPDYFPPKDDEDNELD